MKRHCTAHIVVSVLFIGIDSAIVCGLIAPVY